ncbi:MAG: VanZ family protein [Desulfurivibrionaceae bacterium]
MYFIIFYILLIIYGSLYPLSGWKIPESVVLTDLVVWESFRGDLILNLLVYMPLGFLFVRVVGQRLTVFRLMVLSLLAGAALSLSMETMQLFLPDRVTSPADLVMNTLGTLFGAVLGYYVLGPSITANTLRRYRQRWFRDDSRSSLGLIVGALWGLSQLAPLVPSPGWDNIRHGLKPVRHFLHDLSLFDPLQAAVGFLYLLGLCLVLMSMGRSRNRTLFFSGLVIAGVFLLKVPVVYRQLSVEALAGFVGALIVAFLLRQAGRYFTLYMAGGAVACGFLVQQFRFGSGEQELHHFNWEPFSEHFTGLMGLVNILEGIWPFAALSFLALHLGLDQARMLSAGLAIFVLVLATEWLQGYIPGRHPDITDVILALTGWFIIMLYARVVSRPESA